MEALAKLPDEIAELVSEFLGPSLVGNDIVGITQYTFWMFIAIILFLVFVFAGAKRMTIVPRGRFVNGFEYLVEFVRNDIVYGNIGTKTGDKHAPFLLTLFFFIFINNLVGLVPGCKPGTGTIGVTFALALISFCYFIWVSVKHLGVLGYIKSFAPAGVDGALKPVGIFVGLIEVFSTVLRLITLAVRLFANMFAGHVVMGTFALMTSLCFMPLLSGFTASALAGALPSLAWLLILIVIYAIEMVVAFVQAYVFSMLSAVYIQLAEGGH